VGTNVPIVPGGTEAFSTEMQLGSGWNLSYGKTNTVTLMEFLSPETARP